MDRVKLRRKRLALILIGVLALAIVVVLAVGLPRALRSSAETPAEAPVRADPTPRVREKQTFVEVEKEISAETIQDGLNEIGLLLTEEYYFTEVVSFSSIKTLFHIELGITESKYLASYDGVISAGIDFAGITVEKDEAEKVIVVRIPLPEICAVDIDPDSFELYSEKEGLGNPITMEDYNSSLVELENTARQKAIDRGVLERAAENAQPVIRNFIVSLLGESGYTLRFLPADGT